VSHQFNYSFSKLTYITHLAVLRWIVSAQFQVTLYLVLIPSPYSHTLHCSVQLLTMSIIIMFSGWELFPKILIFFSFSHVFQIMNWCDDSPELGRNCELKIVGYVVADSLLNKWTFQPRSLFWNFSVEVIPYSSVPWTAFFSQGHNDVPKFHYL